MKNSITERILQYIEANDLNFNTLATRIGITRNNFSLWKAGKSEPSPKVILKILWHFPEIDANWLIRGESRGTSQTVQGKNNINQQANGTGNSVINEAAAVYKNEVELLKEIIKSKNEQIELLKSILKS